MDRKMKIISVLKSLTAFFVTVGVTLSLNVYEAYANHVTIENFEVSSTDTAANTITFTGDFSWENSWHSTVNRDAVWIFLKYSTDAGVTWSHASMSQSGTNPIGFSTPSTFEIVVPSDEKGFFLQRTDLATGNVTVNGVKFVWDYAQDGLTDQQALASNTINKVFEKITKRWKTEESMEGNLLPLFM